MIRKSQLETELYSLPPLTPSSPLLSCASLLCNFFSTLSPLESLFLLTCIVFSIYSLSVTLLAGNSQLQPVQCPVCGNYRLSLSIYYQIRLFRNDFLFCLPSRGGSQLLFIIIGYQNIFNNNSNNNNNVIRIGPIIIMYTTAISVIIITHHSVSLCTILCNLLAANKGCKMLLLLTDYNSGTFSPPLTSNYSLNHPLNSTTQYSSIHPSTNSKRKGCLEINNLRQAVHSGRIISYAGALLSIKSFCLLHYACSTFTWLNLHSPTTTLPPPPPV